MLVSTKLVCNFLRIYSTRRGKRDRQIVRQAGRQVETGRQAGRKAETGRERQTDRQRQTDIQKDRDRK